MNINLIPDNFQGKREVSVSGSSMKVYILKRGEKLDDVKSSLYVLMDTRRTCFYVGETGNTIGGGFARRWKQHSNAKPEKWWNLAICISDPTRLDDTDVRKWLEWSLFDKVRTSLFVCTSTATESYANFRANETARKFLKEILSVLSIFGVPWAEIPPIVGIVRHSSPQEEWASVGRLAKALVAKYNGNLGKGGVERILSARRKCASNSKWHSVLIRVGVRINPSGFVTDWKHAMNPLP